MAMIPSKKEREKQKYRMVSAREAEAKQDTGGYTPTNYKLPDGYKNFRFDRAGTYLLDILPFFAGEGNPGADAGMMQYTRAFYDHTNVGAKQQRRPCLTNWGEYLPCPVCEQFARMRQKGEPWDILKEFAPKSRRLYAIIDRSDGKSIKEGVQIMECAFNKGFGELLKNRIDRLPEGDDREQFFSPDDGYTLSVGTSGDKFKGRDVYRADSIDDFMSRKGDHRWEFDLDESKGTVKVKIDGKWWVVPCLDKLVDDARIDYKTYKKLFDMNAAAEEEEQEEAQRTAPSRKQEDEEPASSGKREPTAKDLNLEPGQWVEYKGERYTIKNISKDGTSLKLEDDDENIESGVAPEDVKAVPQPGGKDAEKESEPQRGKAAIRGHASPPSEDDEDEDGDSDLDDGDGDDDEYEEDAVPAGKGGKKPSIHRPEPEDDGDEDERPRGGTTSRR